MSSTIVEAIGVVLASLLGGGGVWAWVQSRQSRREGVQDDDVTRSSTAGEEALELIRELRGQVRCLEASRRETDRHVSRIEALLQHVALTLRESVQALDDLVRWEEGGSAPPPPWRLATIADRLRRVHQTLDRKDTHD